MTIKKAIIPVAGFGTRFLPATKSQPKEMLSIIDKPVVQFLVEEAVASGITDIIFVTSRGKHSIENHFDYSFELEHLLAEKGKSDVLKKIRDISDMARFSYVRQKEAKGNGDALLQAEHLIGGEPCAVLFGDDLVDSKIPCLKQMAAVFEKYREPVAAICRVPKSERKLYGSVGVKKIENGIFEINEIIEKPRSETAALSNFGVVGKYIITPEIFGIFRKLSAEFPRSAERELGITEALQEYLKSRPIYGCEFEGERYDCGSKIGLMKAIVKFGLKHPEVKSDFKKFLKRQNFA